MPALLNGFPFIFPDSGDYLCFHPLLHRSPYYALFIFFFHLNRFIWAPVVVQSLIVSHLLWLLTLLIGGAAHAAARFLLLVILLAVFSSLPFFTGFIMADIFTPIMFLTMYIIVFHYKSLSRPLLVYLLMLDCVATAAHVTNLPLAIGTVALFAVLALSFRQRQHLRPLALLAPPIILTVAADPAFQWRDFWHVVVVAREPVFLSRQSHSSWASTALPRRSVPAGGLQNLRLSGSIAGKRRWIALDDRHLRAVRRVPRHGR